MMVGLFGPEETKIQLNISIRGERVFYELDDGPVRAGFD